jgi:hypothetical protein
MVPTIALAGSETPLTGVRGNVDEECDEVL